MPAQQEDKTAIWVITPNGVDIAQQIKRQLTEADIYVSAKIWPPALSSEWSLRLFKAK